MNHKFKKGDTIGLLESFHKNKSKERTDLKGDEKGFVLNIKKLSEFFEGVHIPTKQNLIFYICLSTKNKTLVLEEKHICNKRIVLLEKKQI